MDAVDAGNLQVPRVVLYGRWFHVAMTVVQWVHLLGCQVVAAKMLATAALHEGQCPVAAL